MELDDLLDAPDPWELVPELFLKVLPWLHAPERPQLAPSVRAFAKAWSLLGDVGNRGLLGWLEGGEGANPAETLDALRTVGLADDARSLEEALATDDRARIEAHGARVTARRDAIVLALAAFARANAADFRFLDATPAGYRSAGPLAGLPVAAILERTDGELAGEACEVYATAEAENERLTDAQAAAWRAYAACAEALARGTAGLAQLDAGALAREGSDALDALGLPLVARAVRGSLASDADHDALRARIAGASEEVLAAVARVARGDPRFATSRDAEQVVPALLVRLAGHPRHPFVLAARAVGAICGDGPTRWLGGRAGDDAALVPDALRAVGLPVLATAIGGALAEAFPNGVPADRAARRVAIGALGPCAFVETLHGDVDAARGEALSALARYARANRDELARLVAPAP